MADPARAPDGFRFPGSSSRMDAPRPTQRCRGTIRSRCSFFGTLGRPSCSGVARWTGGSRTRVWGLAGPRGQWPPALRHPCGRSIVVCRAEFAKQTLPPCRCGYMTLRKNGAGAPGTRGRRSQINRGRQGWCAIIRGIEPRALSPFPGTSRYYDLADPAEMICCPDGPCGLVTHGCPYSEPPPGFEPGSLSSRRRPQVGGVTCADTGLDIAAAHGAVNRWISARGSNPTSRLRGRAGRRRKSRRGLPVGQRQPGRPSAAPFSPAPAVQHHLPVCCRPAWASRA